MIYCDGHDENIAEAVVCVGGLHGRCYLCATCLDKALALFPKVKESEDAKRRRILNTTLETNRNLLKYPECAVDAADRIAELQAQLAALNAPAEGKEAAESSAEKSTTAPIEGEWKATHKAKHSNAPVMFHKEDAGHVMFSRQHCLPVFCFREYWDTFFAPIEAGCGPCWWGRGSLTTPPLPA